MLTRLLIRDETTISLGKTEHLFIIHVSGEKCTLHEWVCQHITQKNKEDPGHMPDLFRVGPAKL